MCNVRLTNGMIGLTLLACALVLLFAGIADAQVAACSPGRVCKTHKFLANGGSAGAPSFSFIADSDTGIYNPSSGSVGIAFNGSRSFETCSAAGVLCGTTDSATFNLRNGVNVGLAHGTSSITSTVGNGSWTIQGGNAAVQTLLVQGAAAQSANVLSINVNGGVEVFGVDPTGAIEIATSAGTSGQCLKSGGAGATVTWGNCGSSPTFTGQKDNHNFGTVAAGACGSDTTLTVTGAALGDPCSVAPMQALVTGGILKCWGSDANVVTIRACCNDGASTCAFSATDDYRVIVFDY